LNKATMGWCVRNHGGSFTIAWTSWKEGQYSIIEGEAYALLEALKVIQQQGLTQVIFETDSKSVVDVIHNIHGGASEFSSIICNINSICYQIQILWSSLLSVKRTWLPIP
jgi:ribonuclease HI